MTFLFENFPVDSLFLLAEGVALKIYLNASKTFCVSAVQNHSIEMWMAFTSWITLVYLRPFLCLPNESNLVSNSHAKQEAATDVAALSKLVLYMKAFPVSSFTLYLLALSLDRKSPVILAQLS